MSASALMILGLVAAAFSTGSFLPQVLKSWKTKRTKDLSLVTLVMLFIGSILWFTYGIILKDIPIMAANGVINILLISVLVLKVKYG